MRSKIKCVVAAASLAVGVLTFFEARPAGAHDVFDWTDEGCLRALHRSDIGGLDYRTYSNGTTTCDGDNNWAGRVKDDHATSDGYCVRAVLDGVLMATSCNSSGSGLHFTDPQQDWYAWTCITESNGSARCTENWNF